jgi:SprT protein
MLLPEQLQFSFTRSAISHGRDAAPEIAGQALRRPSSQTATGAVALQFRHGPDELLEFKARELLVTAGASRIAGEVRIEWSRRLRSCAGRADIRENRILLNPLLHNHGASEIDRTLRHELAHLLAHFRVKRRRIRPHGPEWRAACHDLGIGHESRCHNLPFPVRSRARPYLYKCPNCQRDFPRVRRIRRIVACLACCRAHNRGKFAAKFRLQLIKGA